MGPGDGGKLSAPHQVRVLANALPKRKVSPIFIHGEARVFVPLCFRSYRIGCMLQHFLRTLRREKYDGFSHSDPADEHGDGSPFSACLYCTLYANALLQCSRSKQFRRHLMARLEQPNEWEHVLQICLQESTTTSKSEAVDFSVGQNSDIGSV